MVSRRLFGTDGIRGVANRAPLTPEMIFQLGRAAAYFWRHSTEGKVRVLIGRDTRLSGDILENALITGICSTGVDVLRVGILPTPAIAYLTRQMGVDAGIIISASHNPFEDNGIKLISREGFKLPDEKEKEIEDILFGGKAESFRPVGSQLGRVIQFPQATDLYQEFLLQTVSNIASRISFPGWKIIVDCAHGAVFQIAPRVLKELGAEVVSINDEPDGTNINQNCGSLYPEVIQQIVLEKGAQVGLSFDGDGDRVILVDEKGEIVTGDHVLGICADHLKSAGKLRNNLVVGTVMSNLGLEQYLKNRGISLLRTPVGDRYVIEEMRKRDALLGGEPSGHIIFLVHHTTGDGILTSLQVLSLMQQTGQSLSELAQGILCLPQILLNVKVKHQEDFSRYAEVQKVIRQVEEQLQGKGRFLIRYSGTEPLVRIMVEGEDSQQINLYAREIARVIENILG